MKAIILSAGQGSRLLPFPRSRMFRGSFRMANNKSQEKRNRQNEKHRLANKAVRSELKTRTRRAIAAAEAGDAEDAKEAVRLAKQRIDSAATAGILHRNTAARRKSRLEKQVSTLLG